MTCADDHLAKTGGTLGVRDRINESMNKKHYIWTIVAFILSRHVAVYVYLFLPSPWLLRNLKNGGKTNILLVDQNRKFNKIAHKNVTTKTQKYRYGLTVLWATVPFYWVVCFLLKRYQNELPCFGTTLTRDQRFVKQRINEDLVHCLNSKMILRFRH